MPRRPVVLSLFGAALGALACGKSSSPPTDAAATASSAAPAPVEGRGITMPLRWVGAPPPPMRPASVRKRIEVVVTLAAKGGYLDAPAKRMTLVTKSGARFPVLDPTHASCSDLLADGDTRRCTFRFEVPIPEAPERLELSVPPEPAIGVALVPPPPLAGPCDQDEPCVGCLSPTSGVECQNEALARGLERACTMPDDPRDELGRRVIVYCPPSYRQR